MSASAKRRVWPRLLLALVVGAVFFEVGLRVLLTSPPTRDSALARVLGNPGRFAFSHEDLYWRFVHRLSTSEAPTFEPPHDARLGWTWPDIVPGTYAHSEMDRIAHRRPVMLFGDSYSACLTEREACFQGLMERSHLAEACRLLNYGVCGYGFDQSCLLARAVAERYQGMDPVIVVGLLVDDDLSRMLLTLREYPKPRLRLVDGRVSVTGVPVRSRTEYLAEPGPLPQSWALAWMSQALRSHPLGDPRSPGRIEVEALTRAVVTELVDDLRARDLDFYFLLFHTADNFLAWNPGDWQTQLVTRTLDDLDAPWYEVREELARRLAEGGGAIADFYIPMSEPGGGHYDADGNAAAFAVLLRGLAEVAGLSGELDGRPLPWAYRLSVGDGGGTASYMREPQGSMARVPCANALVLRAPGETPTTLSYDLNGRVSRYAGVLWGFQPDGLAAAFALQAALDGEVVWEGRVESTDEPLPFELDLAGAARLELTLAPHLRRGCAVVADPTLE
ncbi:MAG TPA: hypothetical protein VMT18_03370 [Planctomycetota bacterium]|nr:hypothetical protein [Planctomycetota bacterium]